jgi:hypothetical protein
MSWKVAGFIPHGFDLFVDIILPATLGSTQPLTEVSNRNICGVGGNNVFTFVYQLFQNL